MKLYKRGTHNFVIKLSNTLTFVILIWWNMNMVLKNYNISLWHYRLYAKDLEFYQNKTLMIRFFWKMPFCLFITLSQGEIAYKDTIKKLLKKLMKNTLKKLVNINFHLKEYNIKESSNNKKKINKIDTYKLQIIFNLSLLDWVILLKSFQTFKCTKNVSEFVQWQL